MSKQKTVHISEETFKALLSEAKGETAENLSEAFAAATAELERKGQRNVVVNYFDLNKNVSVAKTKMPVKAK